MENLHVKTDRLGFTVLANAGITTDLYFKDVKGLDHFPLYKNPWLKEKHDVQHPLLGYIQGDFPCIPFGGGRLPETSNWSYDASIADFSDLHGYCTAHPWKIESIPDGAEMSIDYPKDHPIQQVTKRVIADSANVALHTSITILTRQDTNLPFGIHPNIALPHDGSKVRIEPAPFKFAHIIPAETEKNISVLNPGGFFTDLNKAPLQKGGDIDLTQYPLPQKTEEIVQLCGIDGWVKVHFPDYSIKFTWDSKDMPSCILWISNQGRDYSPWNGRNLCLGVEPICGAFDLALGATLRDNPIQQKGVATYHSFKANVPYTFMYTIQLI